MALARACYANVDLALLDDVFSALDATTAGNVFDGLFNKENNGLLRSSGTLLVTHAEQFLPRVDKILLMMQGEPTFFGTFEELQVFAGRDQSAAALIEMSCKSDSDDKEPSKKKKLRKDGAVEDDGIIMTVEERNYGVSSFMDWATWFINAGGIPFVVSQLIFLVLDRGLFVGSDWWLSKWSDSAYKELEIFHFTIPPQSEGREAQKTYVTVYCTIVILSVIATSVRSQWMCKYSSVSVCFIEEKSSHMLYMSQSKEVPAVQKSCSLVWLNECSERLSLISKQPRWVEF